jgi:hypothetical protein
MANLGAPVINLGAPVGPPPVVAPQLPHGADPGTITGWILDQTAAETPTAMTEDVELKFARLTNNIPDVNDADYERVMRQMSDEILNSDSLTCYLG